MGPQSTAHACLAMGTTAQGGEAQGSSMMDLTVAGSALLHQGHKMVAAGGGWLSGRCPHPTPGAPRVDSASKVSRLNDTGWHWADCGTAAAPGPLGFPSDRQNCSCICTAGLRSK